MILKNTLSFLISMLVLNCYSQQIQRMNEKGDTIQVHQETNKNYVQGEVIIKLKEGAVDNEYLKKTTMPEYMSVNDIKQQNYKTQANKKSFYQDYGNHKIRRIVSKYNPSKLKSSRDYGIYRLMVLELPENENIEKVISKLNSYPEIEYAEPNLIVSLDDNPPNDPDYIFQWGFEGTMLSTDTDIDADRAWDFTTGNYGVKVAVVDMGIDYDNIDLGDGSFGNDGDKVRGGWVVQTNPLIFLPDTNVKKIIKNTDKISFLNRFVTAITWNESIGAIIN